MSEIKVNKISPRANCGTVQLGDSGDTFTIPAGATITNSGTASGFGATGSASWNTTVKTSTFTAVAGEGYFVNTTGGAVTVNLPAGVAGAVIAIKDYAGTFDTNPVTLNPNGSDKIGGDNTSDGTLSIEGLAVTLVFVDSTQGWLVTDSGLQSEAPTTKFVTATGGTITTAPCGNFKIHTFTGPGTLCVSCAGNSGGSNTIEYLVVAGGGSGSAKGPGDAGGGGGAGGFRFASPSLAPATYPAKPLAGPAALPVTVTSYPVTVGAGGAGNPNPGGSCAPVGNGANGSPSAFAGSSTITSTGGGKGGYHSTRQCGEGAPGGSGGGGMSGTGSGPTQAGGTGNTPPVSPPQGNPGGSFSYGGSPPNSEAAGGGGAISAAPNSVGGSSAYPGGAGGGFPNAFGTSGESSSPFYYFAGGGGAGAYTQSPTGGLGGGGNVSTAGTANTGGGGGGGKGGPGSAAGNSGGSGIVIIRYKFQ